MAAGPDRPDPGPPPPGTALDWIPAPVPGTVASALDGAGRLPANALRAPDLDRTGWWYRTEFDSPAAGRYWLVLDGLATVATAWVDGRMAARSTSMFERTTLPLDIEAGQHRLHLHFEALAPLLAEKRPRPRWKSTLVAHQNLRWWRTSLLGRMPVDPRQPAPVGPWRPVRLVPAIPSTVLEVIARPALRDGRGTVTVEGRLGAVPAGRVAARVAGPGQEASAGATLAAQPDGSCLLSATVELGRVDRWWPHTHGPSPLYEVRLCGSVDHPLAPVGFRTVAADRASDGFALSVNGVPVFCRGANWTPLDPLTLRSEGDRLSAELELLRAAGMNMLRVPGTTVYEGEEFWQACDRLGLMVWADAMWASMDPPDDRRWEDLFVAEVLEVARRAAAHPSLTVLSGGSEVEQQPAMLGLPPDRCRPSVLDRLGSELAPVAADVPYVTSSPTGGDLPFWPGSGVAHYFGVGAYRRPLSDVRSAGVRFAAECLAFSIPPEPVAVDEMGGPGMAAHDPLWKAGVPGHDRPVDDEDVRHAYCRDLFGVDVVALRLTDPGLALDYGRAAVAEAMTSSYGYWRRSRSGCAGALVLQWHDSRPGAGWGLVDSSGRPKAPLYALKRLLQPVAAWFADDGMNGLRLVLANDGPVEVEASMRLEAFSSAGRLIAEGSATVSIPARGVREQAADLLLGGFRDLSWSYRFGPPAYDCVAVTLDAPEFGGCVPRAVFFPAGPARPRLPDIGLEAAVRADPGEGRWLLSVGSRLAAQWVAIDCPGFAISDSWFHLAPGRPHTVVLSGSPEQVPSGAVRALNSEAGATFG